MKNPCVLLLLAPFFLFNALLFSQNTFPERQADFNFKVESAAVRFTPVSQPLHQIAGARPAYWSYYWEFGDGSFSNKENPMHTYAKPGDYIASVDATAHYDNGKKPKKKKKTVTVSKRSEAITSLEMPDVFEEKSKQAVAMGANAKPRAEEELTCIISYRNNSFVSTDGRLHLFFNQKKYPSPHFTFAEARTHFGETADPLYSQALPQHTPPTADWTAFSLRSSTGASTSFSAETAPFGILEDMLNNARGAYREENAWRFTELQPGERRNLFVSLAATPNMVKDTSATIHLEAVFAPFDPAVAPERFVMEIEIVASHDPNAIAVSDNRVNYRTIGNKNFAYKVQFQNNGEGPASTVELKVEIPKGLNVKRMRPIDWYPKCPICPKAPDKNSCLDTAYSNDGLRFTFRNVYLPGSRQEDVDDRDSTKGFVKYRIEADKNMPKLPFRSRAKIVFDKNPPIYTNFTKTRFKVGISPGVKIGYNYDNKEKLERYFLFGVSLSPYKSWRVYPQVELLTGIKGGEFLPEQTSRTSVDSTDGGFKVTYTFDTLITTKRGFVSFEVPFMLRKNFSRAFGVGLGGSARIILENGEDCIHVDIVKHYAPPVNIDFPPELVVDTIHIYPYSATRARFTVFGDLTFGSVRAGPNLGIRAGAVLGRQRKFQPFVQVSLEMKL